MANWANTNFNAGQINQNWQREQRKMEEQQSKTDEAYKSAGINPLTGIPDNWQQMAGTSQPPAGAQAPEAAPIAPDPDKDAGPLADRGAYKKGSRRIVAPNKRFTPVLKK